MTRAAADYAAPVSAVARTRRWTGAAPARRLRLLTAVVGLAVLLGVGGVVVERARSQPAWIALSSGTVALGADGQVQEVPTGSGRVLPGTRVLRGPGSAERAAAEQAWLSAGSVPAVPELGGSDLVRAALLDLHVLSQTYGVPVAGWTGPWRYVWPRDSALAAAGLRPDRPPRRRRTDHRLPRADPARIGGLSGPPPARRQWSSRRPRGAVGRHGLGLVGDGASRRHPAAGPTSRLRPPSPGPDRAFPARLR